MVSFSLRNQVSWRFAKCLVSLFRILTASSNGYSPTFNDTVEEIQGIARFADTLPGVDKIHLLPYHRLGQDKYEGLGRPYLMGNVEPPSKEHMETLKKAVHAVCGLDCQIGG